MTLEMRRWTMGGIAIRSRAVFVSLIMTALGEEFSLQVG